MTESIIHDFSDLGKRLKELEGKKPQTAQRFPVPTVRFVECSKCFGSGRIVVNGNKRTCPDCNGQGAVEV